MTVKVANPGESAAHRASVVVGSEPLRPAVEVRPVRVILSGTVVVDFEVVFAEASGAVRHEIIRIEFPDEVRSMLETSTWTRGTSISEAITRLGATFLERNRLFETVGSFDVSDPVRDRPPTFHLPLSYLRSSIATVCASAT